MTGVDLLSGNTQYAYDPNDRLKSVCKTRVRVS
jgi:YD repeat-containing protein